MTYQPATIVSDEGTVLARVSDGALSSGNDEGLKRFTAYCAHKGEQDFEEIDLDAKNERYARECAVLELAQGYEPGMIVHHVEGPRFGLYM
jgi:hypothetical protein